MLLYSICYYYGKNKVSNILNHLDTFKKLDHNEKEFVLVNMVDSNNETYFNKIEKELSLIIINYDINIKFKIISSFNWGGTILGLWLTYNYGKIYDDNCYISHFEEDFYPINDKWYEDSFNLLNCKENNYIYIGEHIPPGSENHVTNNIKKTDKTDFMSIINKYNNSTFNNIACWTDGGFYFSTIENLKLIENKIGIFHKGDCNFKYDHFLDGIALGEVGFPSLLFHNNFNYIGLYRHSYFIHKE